MLGDLKSFFLKSSVAEVGVGITVGVAFTNLIGEITSAGRGLFEGQADLGGVAQAAVALLVAALLSVFLVVKPLARLRATFDRAQLGVVAAATEDAGTEVTPPLADEGADDGIVAGTSADPMLESVEVVGPVEATESADSFAASSVEPADYLTMPSVPPMFGTSATPAIAAGEPLLGDPLAAREEPSVTEAAASPVIDLTDEPNTPAADAGPTTAGVPFSAGPTKVCPYCAFDIPAIASRCGYCTADLTDISRAAGVVLVDSDRST
ncbi:MAG TPA: hypothetical protein VM345_17275 [Acidimicrobiales bacterium]|nr:hypothetical protein [Acidimicrobiales bacterium]